MTKPPTISDRGDMIRQMRPTRMPGRWVLRTVSDAEFSLLLPRIRAMFREEEGISVVVPAAEADTDAMAQITLQVYSALNGVGLMAAVATTLADAGISCNAVAATCHDHIFVAETRADEAVALLQARAAEEAAAETLRKGTAYV